MLYLNKTYQLFIFSIIWCLFPQLGMSNESLNLLYGDPSFEAGMNGWIAHSAPNKYDYMANYNFMLRHKGIISSKIVISPKAPDGQQVIQLEAFSKHKNLITGKSSFLKGNSSYVFKASIRCDPSAVISMSLLPNSTENKLIMHSPTAQKKHC